MVGKDWWRMVGNVLVVGCSGMVGKERIRRIVYK